MVSLIGNSDAFTSFSIESQVAPNPGANNNQNGSQASDNYNSTSGYDSNSIHGLDVDQIVLRNKENIYENKTQKIDSLTDSSDIAYVKKTETDPLKDKLKYITQNTLSSGEWLSLKSPNIHLENDVHIDKIYLKIANTWTDVTAFITTDIASNKYKLKYITQTQAGWLDITAPKTNLKSPSTYCNKLMLSKNANQAEHYDVAQALNNQILITRNMTQTNIWLDITSPNTHIYNPCHIDDLRSKDANGNEIKVVPKIEALETLVNTKQNIGVLNRHKSGEIIGDHDMTAAFSYQSLTFMFNRNFNKKIGTVGGSDYADSIQMSSWGDATGGGKNQLSISKRDKLRMILKRANFKNPSAPFSQTSNECYAEVLTKTFENELTDNDLKIDCKEIKATKLIAPVGNLIGLDAFVSGYISNYTTTSDSVNVKALIDDGLGVKWIASIRAVNGTYRRLYPPMPELAQYLASDDGTYHTNDNTNVYTPNNVNDSVLDAQTTVENVRGHVRTAAERHIYTEPENLPDVPWHMMNTHGHNDFKSWKNPLAYPSYGISNPGLFGDITFAWIVDFDEETHPGGPIQSFTSLMMIKYLYNNHERQIMLNTGVCLRLLMTVADLTSIAYDADSKIFLNPSRLPVYWSRAVNSEAITVGGLTKQTLQTVFNEDVNGFPMKVYGVADFHNGGVGHASMPLNYNAYGIALGTTITSDALQNQTLINTLVTEKNIFSNPNPYDAAIIIKTPILNNLSPIISILSINGTFEMTGGLGTAGNFDITAGIKQKIINFGGFDYPAIQLFQNISENVAGQLVSPEFKHLTNEGGNSNSNIHLLQNGTVIINDLFVNRQNSDGDFEVHRAITWEDLPALIKLASLPDPNDFKVPAGGVITAGSNLNSARSPYPLAYVDTEGKLNSSTLYSSVFNDQVFGVDDPDTGANRKPNRYLSGLVPSAETVADRTTKYLRADGTWSLVPIISDQPTFKKLTVGNTGSQETIGLFQSTDNDCSVRIEGRGEAYLELSNTSPNNGSNANAWGIGVNDSNRLEFNWKPKGTTLNATTNAMTITHDGKIGINKGHNVIPTETLDVNGTVKATKFIGDGSELTGLDATKVGNLKIFKGGTDYTFLYHGNNNNADAIRLGPSMLQLNSGGSSSTSASIDFSVGGSMFCQMSQYSDSINFIKNVEFTADIEWTPDGVNKVPLLDMYEDVNIIKNKNVPDFDDITTANKFLITNTANGGSITYITPTTDMINEGNNNLYYTDERVEAEIQIKMESGELTNIITNQLQAQTLVANSDIRLKKEIKKLSRSYIDVLEPVEYKFKDDDTRIRYGFIAQDVEEDLPDLVHTNAEGIKGINYQDIIALLVKDNQELNIRISNLENKYLNT